MKIPAIIPAALCVVAGLLLLGTELADASPEIMPISFGLYFIGKGLFIHRLLLAADDFKIPR